MKPICSLLTNRFTTATCPKLFIWTKLWSTFFPCEELNLIITFISQKYELDSANSNATFALSGLKLLLNSQYTKIIAEILPQLSEYFNYTVLHPESYQMYRVLLRDINLTISPLLLGTAEEIHHLLF